MWPCAQLCLTLCDPMDYTVHGILQERILEYVAFPFSGDLPYTGIEPRSPTLQAEFLPAEPQGKPKNTGVVSLSLFQWIFSTQELNSGLLHCRWILYQLSHKGNSTLSESLVPRWWLSWLRIRLQCRRPEFNSWVRKIRWRRDRLPTPVFWPGEFHGLYRPWGCKSRTRPSDFHFPSLQVGSLAVTDMVQRNRTSS